MKRTKLDLSPERVLVTNLIVSDRFLTEIAPLLNINHLQAGYARSVAKWILEYHQQFGRAPGRDIQEVYRLNKKTLHDDKEAENVATFLRGISEDYEAASDLHNVDFEVTQAVNYLNMRSLETLSQDLTGAIDSGDILRAQSAVSNYTRVVPPTGEGISLLHDTSKVIQAFFDEEDTLFQFPGAVGQVCGKFNRGDFAAYLAPMKRGKTWWLWYTAEMAIHQNLKVVFFTLEMTWKQMVRRAWQSLLGSPKEGGTIKIPRFIEAGESGKVTIEVTEETRKPVDPTAVGNIQKKLKRMFRGGDVQIIAVPSQAATVEDLDSMLDNMHHYEGFVPDVIVFDYADIIRPSKGQSDYRHQLDGIWKGLRRMAQQRNCLVVTASQAEKSSFGKDMTQQHVAEDIRKLAHVTHMMALNQNPDEKEQGIMRVAQIAVREGRQEFRQALVLQCLDIGRPVLDSRFVDQVVLAPVNLRYLQRAPRPRTRTRTL